MGKVYEYSFCNIAATSASRGQGGLYSWRDSHLITPHTARVNWKGHESEYVFFLDSHWFKSISRAPLNGRGWVFQERLLSPRTIHFSSQLFWECRTLKACETYPCGLPSEPSILGDDVDQTFPGSTKDWRDGLERDGVEHWELLTQMFCRCYLTKESDRLAAIAGIASQAQLLLNDEYLAGLWKRQLPHGLLWKLQNMVGQDDLIVTRPTKYRGPSWSWASLDFEAANINILDREGIDRNLVEITEVKIESSTDQIYTNVTGGYIRVLGKLGQVNLPKLEDAEWRGDRGGHYTFEFSLDVDDEIDIEEETPYCIPILTHDRANRNPFKSLEVHCLLLQKVETNSIGFRRIGSLQVLLDWEAETTEEFRWITDFARDESPLVQGLDMLMIY
ncbi:HET domain-containing protein [Fusarium keratoplasticum]|uniref:HET domain-containing protein n=1 Tax=Fusarium keratoplasticum TaxID=1328300 RepID=A0ACC0QXJ8_9HYPO|nr:HET domain-containing protein [Fusarium keratoplasticum]KAI8669600.1 HET domain-containing protein [Fusarium keratoplasticum]